MSSVQAPKRWKRRSAIVAACAGCATLSISEPGRMVVAAALHDPLSLLAQRSPGSRAPGALTQTKHAKKKRAAVRRRGPGGGGPRERVLSNVRSRPPAGPAAGAPAGTSTSLSLPDALPPVGDVSLPGTQPADSPASFGEPAPGSPYAASPVGGGGGGGGGVTNPGSGDTPPATGATPTPPVSGVPEPSTWLMMIVGFGAIGSVLRRRRAAAARILLPSDPA